MHAFNFNDQEQTSKKYDKQEHVNQSIKKRKKNQTN